MRWMEMIQGTERCLWCDASFHGSMGWAWVLGVSKPTMLCEICTNQLQRIEDLLCEECGRPRLVVSNDREEARSEVVSEKTNSVISEKIEESICYDCRRWKGKSPWDSWPFQHRALYVYDEFMQEILASFKYRGDVALSKLFTSDLYKLARKSFGTFDYVVPIPLKDSRHWERGFNQAEVLAQGFPQMNELLVRVGKSEQKQSKRGRDDRIESLRGAFALSGLGSRECVDLNGKRVLIVDDIYTTGATIRSAAEVLYRGGAKEVCAVTVARSIGKKMRLSMGAWDENQ